MAPSGRKFPISVQWRWRAGLLALLLLELGLCGRYFRENIRDFYPRGFDQSQYLVDTYALTRRAEAGSAPQVLLAAALAPAPTSLLFRAEGAVFQLLFGHGRASCLLMGFLGFALLQMVAFEAFAGWEGPGTALVAIGLLLLVNTPFAIVGSLFDYRIDFLAMCLYGAFVLGIASSRRGQSRGWLLLSSGLGIALALNRFIALAYILPVIFVAGAIASLGAPGRKETLARLKSFLVAFVPLFAIGGAAVWRCWDAISHYYIVGHVTGREKYARAIEAGVSDFFSHLTYYGNSVIHDHLGKAFWRGALVVAVGSALLRWFGGPRQEPSVRKSELRFRIAVLGVGILIPYIVLTLDVAKSPVVGSIMVPCLVFLIATLSASLARFADDSRAKRWLRATLFATTLLLGLRVFARHSLEKPDVAQRSKLQGVNELYLRIYSDAVARGNENPRIAFDLAQDPYVAQALTDRVFESESAWLDVRQALPGSLYPFTLEQIIAGLREADYFVHTRVSGGIEPYPSSVSMQTLFPKYEPWLAENMRRIAEFPVPFGVAELYVRNQSLSTQLQYRHE